MFNYSNYIYNETSKEYLYISFNFNFNYTL